MNSHQLQQETDELGFVEIQVQDVIPAPPPPPTSENFEHLTVEEMQRLCQIEEEDKIRNKNKNNNSSKSKQNDQWKRDTETEEQKRIAIELLNVKSTNSGQNATNDETDMLTQKVNEQNSETCEKSEFVKMMNHLHAPVTTAESSQQSDKKKELPSWLSKLDPEDQKEFLAAAGLI